MTTERHEPVVSIGLPVYNGERWLRGAFDCLLGQTYGNIELVVCDNASTDATAAICAEYVERDPRVRYYRNASNVGTRGPNGNFCRVLAHATGEYFMWASADDGRDPTVVERCVTVLQQHPEAILAHGSVEVAFRTRRDIVEVSNDIDLETPDPQVRVQRFTREMGHNAMIYGVFRRDALLQTRYGDHYGHDYLVCLQACLLGSVEHIRAPLLRYRQRNDAINDVMYDRRPVSVVDLCLYRGVRRTKCWVTLIAGGVYLLRLARVPLSDRVRGTVAYSKAFVSRYWKHLATELLFILVTPLHWLASPFSGPGVKLKTGFQRWRVHSPDAKR